MTALNPTLAALSPPGPRTGATGARSFGAGDFAPGEFGARLAEATRGASGREPPRSAPSRETASGQDGPDGPDTPPAAEVDEADAEGLRPSRRAKAAPAHATGEANAASQPPGTEPAPAGSFGSLVTPSGATLAGQPAEGSGSGMSPQTASAASAAAAAASNPAAVSATSAASVAAAAAAAQAAGTTGTATAGAGADGADVAASAGSLRAARAARTDRLAAAAGESTSSSTTGSLPGSATASAAATATTSTSTSTSTSSSASPATRPAGATATAGTADDFRARLTRGLDAASGVAQPATEAAAAAQATGASGPAASSAAPASVAPASSSPGANGALPGLPGLGAAGAAFGADPLARGTGAGEAGPHFTLSPALDSPTFAPALGLQLSVLARDGIERARMQLNPLELGPIGVQLTVTGQQVQLELVAEHARTRQVLEQSLPQLASSLGDAGFTLSGGGVFQHPQQAREGRDGTPGQGSAARPGARETGASEGEATREAALGVRPRAPRGLVDLYA